MARMYVYLGVVLALVGSLIALFSYVTINSVPIMAVGLSTLILGLASIGLANTRPKLSPEACTMFLKAGVKNTLAILEELGVKSRAIYLPRSMMKGHSEAIIFLDEESEARNIEERLSSFFVVGYEFSLPTREKSTQEFTEVLPKHIVSGHNLGLKDRVIAVTTLGNVSLDFLRETPKHNEGAIKSAIEHIVTRVLDIAGGVSVNIGNSSVKVKVTGVDMMDKELFYEESLYSHILGSPIASIAAAICSEAMEKPVSITFETMHRETLFIDLEVIY
jgi:hypothetical protein